MSQGYSARSTMIGIAAVIGSGFCMLSSDALARAAMKQVPLGEAIFGRAIVAFVLLALAGIATRQLTPVKGLASPAVGLRIAAEIIAGFSFVSALNHMPIANATSVLQFIPLVTTLAAAWLFKEHVGWQRWLAGIAGLVGVMLILRPGPDGFNWWSLLAVNAMLFMSIRDLATSRISRAIPTFLIGAATAAAAALSGAALSFVVPWQMPTPETLAYLAGSGAMLAGGFFCLVVGMRSAEMSVLAPFRYTVIIWAIIMGYMFWGELPDSVASIGIAIVIVAGLLTFARERRLRRHAAITTTTR